MLKVPSIEVEVPIEMTPIRHRSKSMGIIRLLEHFKSPKDNVVKHEKETEEKLDSPLVMSDDDSGGMYIFVQVNYSGFEWIVFLICLALEVLVKLYTPSWESWYNWQGGGRLLPLTAKNLPKIEKKWGKKSGKFGEKIRKKWGKKRTNREEKAKIRKFLSLCPSWQIGLATLLRESDFSIAAARTVVS